MQIGPYVFPSMTKARKFHYLDEKADHDEDIEPPEPGTGVPSDMRALLEQVEPWTTAPDYERTRMINRILKNMWPTLTDAIMKEVFTKLKPILKEKVFDKYPFIEDIVLGTESMKEGGLDYAAWIKDRKKFTPGTVAPKFGGFKVYNTGEDEVVLEVPIIWGSDMHFSIGAFIKAGPVRLYVPVDVSNLSVKAEARVTLKPLVDVIPCVGGVTVALLKVPQVDLSLCLFKGVDLMALPIVKDAVKQGIKMVTETMLVLPNHISVPLMPNWGLPLPPKGALNVKLLRSERVKAKNVYIMMQVRKGRKITSETVKPESTKANPILTCEFNQEFNFVVDDYELQSLSLDVFNDDFGTTNDTKLSIGRLPFSEIDGSKQLESGDIVDNYALAEFIKNPMKEQLVEIKLQKNVEKAGLMGSLRRMGSMGMKSSRGDVEGEVQAASPKEENIDYGSVYLKVMFMPFFQPKFDDEAAAAAGQASVKQGEKSLAPMSRTVTSKVADNLRGVVNVNLIRCTNLKGDDLSSYVKITVSDDDLEQVQKSDLVVSQNNPRWGQMFDFVMVTAGSTIHFNVYSKGARGVLSATVGSCTSCFKSSKDLEKSQESNDKLLGRFTMPVKDIARNGSMKDTWTLTDSETGEIELALTWATCYISDEI
jgi:hypothetical protein